MITSSSNRHVRDTIALQKKAREREERDLFAARYFFGASPAELAARTGLTENAVAGRLRRMRTKLKNCLKEEGTA